MSDVRALFWAIILLAMLWALALTAAAHYD